MARTNDPHAATVKAWQTRARNAGGGETVQQGHDFAQWGKGKAGVVIGNDDPKTLGRAIAAALWEIYGERSDMDPEKVARNWQKEFKGRVVTDPQKVALLKAAVKENRDNPEYMQLVNSYGGEGVIVLAEPSKDAKFLMMGGDGEAGQRQGVVTAVWANAGKLINFENLANDHDDPRPGLPSSGLAGLLRHEFGHAIHDSMDSEVKAFATKLWYNIPNPKETFSYYAGFNPDGGDHEGFPEAIALGTDPRYKPSEWHPAVRDYVAFCIQAARTVRPRRRRP